MAYRYKTTKVNGKTKLLHRHLMEQKLGRRLQRNEHVHHKNEKPHDNRMSNLVLMTPRAHQALHKTKYPRVKSCQWCGKRFTPKPTKRKRAKTCGRHTCRFKLTWKTRRANKRSAA